VCTALHNEQVHTRGAHLHNLND